MSYQSCHSPVDLRLPSTVSVTVDYVLLYYKLQHSRMQTKTSLRIVFIGMTLLIRIMSVISGNYAFRTATKILYRYYKYY